MKQKSINKKIRRLQMSIAKNTKKLEKLRRKLVMASKKTPPKKAASKKKPDKSAERAKGVKPAALPQKKQKKKRQLSPEARAKLAAMMKERWAAKKAAGAPRANVESSSGTGANESELSPG